MDQIDDLLRSAFELYVELKRLFLISRCSVLLRVLGAATISISSENRPGAGTHHARVTTEKVNAFPAHVVIRALSQRSRSFVTGLTKNDAKPNIHFSANCPTTSESNGNPNKLRDRFFCSIKCYKRNDRAIY
ncbi:unnamed protein product [Nesidiocoris tenuis]|uniref:Uncharacterized protein n=1 Tax=Nesidiocoris tenuis TaxID=355587 RepID=A0A6H5G6L5_9HEMI|nr:unnamed protein product [Nesidiocoris tenuis]